MANAVDGRAADEVVEEAVPVCGHREQIDAPLLREADQFIRRIAHRELSGHLQPVRRQISSNAREVIAIVLHLLGLAQLELIKVARGPAIRDMHEMQLRADLRRELAHVVQNRLVGGGMLDGNENAAVHRYASVCTSSHELSAAMITATVHASTRTQPGATNGPIFAGSQVNSTSGNTAKDS